MDFKSQLELLKNIQAMAEKANTIELFREMLKVVIMGIEGLSKIKGIK